MLHVSYGFTGLRIAYLMLFCSSAVTNQLFDGRRTGLKAFTTCGLRYGFDLGRYCRRNHPVKKTRHTKRLPAVVAKPLTSEDAGKLGCIH